MKDHAIKEAEERGFTQGVAWAIAVQDRWQLSPGQLMKESGIKVDDFKKARVDPNDLRIIRKVAKLEGLQ